MYKRGSRVTEYDLYGADIGFSVQVLTTGFQNRTTAATKNEPNFFTIACVTVHRLL